MLLEILCSTASRTELCPGGVAGPKQVSDTDRVGCERNVRSLCKWDQIHERIKS